MNSNFLTHPKYRSDIDGLRAIAVLSVVGFHAFGVRGGFSGVDIFFVLSGYLISTIIFENLEKNSFVFKEFYFRRIRRIFPTLLVVLFTSLFVGWILLFGDEYEQLGKHVLAGASFSSNFVLFRESGYFDIAAEKKPLLHLWSLGIEEQYYIFWPLITFFLWRYKKYFCILISALIILFFSINIYLIKVDPVATFYLPYTRFWELLIGSFIAYLIIFRKQQLTSSPYLLNLLSISGLFLIVSAIVFFNSKILFPGWWALFPTLGTALIILSGPQTFISKNFLSNRLFVSIGLISFPLYLWHWPILSFLKILDGQYKASKFIAVVISIIFAWLTYKYIEKPIRFGGYQLQKTLRLVFLMICAGLVGAVIYNLNGIPSRINDGSRGGVVNNYRSQIMWPEENNSSKECIQKFGADQYCLIGEINKPPTVAIIGDSHANHFYFGLNDYVASHGGNLLLFGAGACLPFLGIDRGRHPQAGNVNCFDRTHKLYHYVLNQDSIKFVIFSFVHNEPYRNDVQFIDRWGKINGDDNYHNSVDAFVRTIKMFEEKGKKVILIYDLPNLVADPRDCFSHRPFFSARYICDLNSLNMIRDFERYDQFLVDVKSKTSLSIYNTHQYIQGNFPVNSEGVLTYRDATHLSIAGSIFFANKYNFLD